MKIEVRLFATLAAYLPEGSDGRSVTLDLPDGSTVGEIVRALGIPEEMPLVAMADGRDAELGQPLADGVMLSFFPPLAGGR